VENALARTHLVIFLPVRTGATLRENFFFQHFKFLNTLISKFPTYLFSFDNQAWSELKRMGYISKYF
jgi:hypothetical protein